LPYLQRLGINTLIITDVNPDPNADKSSCMALLEKAGIYVLILLSGYTPQSYIQNGVGMRPVDYTFFEYITNLADIFSPYANTLGFYVFAKPSYDKRRDKHPSMKSWIVYVKNYIKGKGYRQIPVGLWNEGVDFNSSGLANYYNCGNSEQSIDFYILGFGLKQNAQCIENSTIFQNDPIGQYQNYSVPALLTNGCLEKKRHSFSEVETIYGEASKVFSGTIVRDWLPELYRGADLGMFNLLQSKNRTQDTNIPRTR
jgi:1,3-beta-glucanosyltransferase GAS1